MGKTLLSAAKGFATAYDLSNQPGGPASLSWTQLLHAYYCLLMQPKHRRRNSTLGALRKIPTAGVLVLGVALGLLVAQILFSPVSMVSWMCWRILKASSAFNNFIMVWRTDKTIACTIPYERCAP